MPKILKSNRDIQFYIEDFMEYCSLKGLSVKTMSSYETTLKLLAKYLQEEYGITLTIYSQKTKPNDHEEDNL